MAIVTERRTSRRVCPCALFRRSAAHSRRVSGRVRAQSVEESDDGDQHNDPEDEREIRRWIGECEDDSETQRRQSESEDGVAGDVRDGAVRKPRGLVVSGNEERPLAKPDQVAQYYQECADAEPLDRDGGQTEHGLEFIRSSHRIDGERSRHDDPVERGSFAECVLRPSILAALHRTAREQFTPGHLLAVAAVLGLLAFVVGISRDVLVSTDGSDCANQALTLGVDVTDAEDAALHLLSVIALSALGADARPDIQVDMLEESANDPLDEAAAFADDAGVGPASKTVEYDPSIHKAILTYIEDHDITLVVVGTHGRTDFDRYVLGSVTEYLVRTSPIPVLPVRAPVTEP